MVTMVHRIEITMVIDQQTVHTYAVGILFVGIAFSRDVATIKLFIPKCPLLITFANRSDPDRARQNVMENNAFAPLEQMLHFP